MEINFATPVCQTGYGIVGINLLTALMRAGHEVALFPIGPLANPPPDSQAIVQTALLKQEKFNSCAPSVFLKEITLPTEPIGNGPRCLFTIFELDRLTKDECDCLRAMDRIFVCSEWAREILLQHGTSPNAVHVVPLGVDGTIFSPTLSAPEHISSETIFVNVGKFELRKGHDALVEVFNLAFEPKDKVRLFIHGRNNQLGESYNQFWVDHCKSSRLGDKITLVKEPFGSQQEVAQFMAQADCGVFPARAEGWNLELLEMMALGKTVIATNYSGHTAFADEKNCLLIKVSDLEEAHDGVKFQGQGRWARLGAEQIEQLVCHLRAVHQKKQTGKLELNDAGIATAQRLSWENSAERLVANLP